jgi:hypothetical protein
MDDIDISSIESNDTANNHLIDDDHTQLRLKLQIINNFIHAMMLQMREQLQYLIFLSSFVPLVRRRRRRKRIRRRNIHRDRSSVMSFIHSWSDEMFKRQFRLTRPDFFLLEATIMEYMEMSGYDFEQHTRYATRSSGSPILLELRLYITLRILSGASYLDMIWYGVEIKTVPVIFWKTICEIDAALDNINFPTDEVGIRQVVDNWAAKRRDRHGFTTNMGTALAVDGFVIETVKPDAKDLNGQEVSCYRNRKGVWGLISQVGCDANAKIRYVQTDWPGATNDLSCFRESPLFLFLKSQDSPSWMHIVADEAYAPLSVECGGRILTPYSQHQLNSAKQKDWQNLQDWEDRIANDPDVSVDKPIEEYWKMRAYNHELSSERITIERVLGMVVRRFGMLWRPIEYNLAKVPTIFRVMCKLHNLCMDRWMIDNPAGARLGNYPSSMPFSSDSNLWHTFDISVGLDDVFEQPTDEVIIERLENRYESLGDRRRAYASRNIPLRESLTEELYSLGIRFNKGLELY